MNDDYIVMVIFLKQDDFCGIFGDVEWVVVSYKDMKGYYYQLFF